MKNSRKVILFVRITTYVLVGMALGLYWIMFQYPDTNPGCYWAFITLSSLSLPGVLVLIAEQIARLVEEAPDLRASLDEVAEYSRERQQRMAERKEWEKHVQEVRNNLADDLLWALEFRTTPRIRLAPHADSSK